MPTPRGVVAQQACAYPDGAKVFSQAMLDLKDGKISHEHICWDQAGVLAQVGLLNPAGLPVTGAASARKVLDSKLPSRVF